jgi:hypothetical protein
VVRGELVVSWVMVLRLEAGAILKRANRSGVGVVWAGNCRMSNARVVFEMEVK